MPTATTRIDADLLIPGRGDPITSATVLVEDATITYVGPAAGAPDTPDATVVAVPTVMPGMWETHAHFLGLRTANLEALATIPPHLGVLRAARSAERLLAAGFTSVREVGGYGTYLATAVEEGTVTGPSIYAAGAFLSQTGGHADIHGLPEAQAKELFERHLGSSTLCDGPEDCRRQVRRQLRLGAKVIKVCASGGVMSQIDHPLHQQFSAAELGAIVEEAARAERVVAAHCHGKPGIMAALQAGVRTIEHGTFLDEEAAELMLETGALLVGTRFIVDYLLAVGKNRGMPDYAFTKISALADRHAQALRLAIEAGIPMALGTDIFIVDEVGRNGEELGLLADLGMTPLQAIEAATANGPLTVGPQAPRSGVLAPGYDADIIAVDGDPLADLSLLADPRRVTHVWKSGHLVSP